MKSVKGPAFTAGKAGPAGKTSPAGAPAVDQQSEDAASLLRNFDHHSVRAEPPCGCCGCRGAGHELASSLFSRRSGPPSA